MWRFNFFCWGNFPSQNLPQHSPLELRTRTFQKPTAQGEAKNKPKAKTFQKPTPQWDAIKKEGKPCGVFTFFAQLVFPARTFHEGKQCGVLTFFAALIFPTRNLPRHSPFELRTRTFQKPTTRWEAKNKPKAHTFQKPTPDWDTIHRGENHVAFSLFLLSSFSQPEPSTTQPFWVTNQETSRSLQLKEKPKTNPKLKPSRSLHLNKMLYKGGKTMWRFHFFCSVSFPSQYLPRHNPFELRTKTFQKPTTRWEAKNKPKAHTFQKPTPDWDTIHRGENHVAFSLFLLSSFSQPEPSTTQPFWVTNQEASRSLQRKEKPKTNPKLKPVAFSLFLLS